LNLTSQFDKKTFFLELWAHKPHKKKPPGYNDARSNPYSPARAASTSTEISQHGSRYNADSRAGNAYEYHGDSRHHEIVMVETMTTSMAQEAMKAVRVITMTTRAAQDIMIAAMVQMIIETMIISTAQEIMKAVQVRIMISRTAQETMKAVMVQGT